MRQQPRITRLGIIALWIPLLGASAGNELRAASGLAEIFISRRDVF
jgi:hypothetical protein